MASKAAAQAAKQLRVGIIGEYTLADSAEGTCVRNVCPPKRHMLMEETCYPRR